MQAREDVQIDWRALRAALGLTQVQLARLLKVSNSTIYGLERKRGRQPHPIVIDKLRRIMRTEPFHLILSQSSYQYPYAGDWKGR